MKLRDFDGRKKRKRLTDRVVLGQEENFKLVRQAIHDDEEFRTRLVKGLPIPERLKRFLK